MKKLMFTGAVVVVVLLTATTMMARNAPGPDTGFGQPLTITTIGNETVAVAPLASSGRLYPSLPDFVSAMPVIVEARVTRTSGIAFEHQPPPNREGAMAGEGPDLYGAIDVEIISVLKGEPTLKTLRLVYQSGKRDGQDRSKRIAYVDEGLSAIQLPNGQLRPAGELANQTFILFLQPTLVDEKAYMLAHASGVAEVTNNGRLKFGGDERAPVTPDGNPANSPTISVADVRAAVR